MSEMEDYREDSELDRLLGFQMQMTDVLLVEAARGALEPFGVTPARLAALLLIRSNDGCDQSTLGRALRVNRSSAMKLVNLLIDRNLIERGPGRDMRSHALHLTEHGERQIDRMVAAVREAEDRASSALDPDEKATLVRLLRKMRAGREI